MIEYQESSLMVIYSLLLLAALALLFYVVYPFILQRLRLWLWRRSLDVRTHQISFDKLYDQVDGFALSKEARLTGDSPQFVYGEIDFESFIALLSLCNPNANTIFVDLGSGSGKAVLACAMVFNVKKSCGIEWFPSLYQCAISQQAQLLSWPNYTVLRERIFFSQGDLLDYPLTDATLVFINATAFFGEYWADISRHLEQVTPGALVISTSKPLRSNQFETLSITKVLMSWGVVQAFIQKRVNIVSVQI